MEGAVHQVAAKAAKVTIPVPADTVPLALVPPPGTPGAKNQAMSFEIQHPGGVLTATLKVPSLQKLAAAAAAAEHGGFIVFQGKLGPNNTLIEAGAIFQPNAPKAESTPN